MREREIPRAKSMPRARIRFGIVNGETIQNYVPPDTMQYGAPRGILWKMSKQNPNMSRLEWVKTFVARPDNLSLIPESHLLGNEIWLWQVSLRLPPVCRYTRIHTCTRRVHVNTGLTVLLVLRWRLCERQEAKEHRDRWATRQEPAQNVGHFCTIAGLTQKAESSVELRDMKAGFSSFEIML